MRRYFVYILCSKRNGTLYIGVTNDIVRRVGEHINKLVPGFTRDYNVNRLVYVEEFQYVDQALQREKSLKNWNRAWKIKLIEQANPGWNDIYSDLYGIH